MYAQHERKRWSVLRISHPPTRRPYRGYVVVHPVRRTALCVQPWYMRAYPYADVCKGIEIPGQWVWFVLVDRRCPINGHATQDEAQKDWQIQPVAAPHQAVVPASLTLQRACSDPFPTELH